MSRTKAMPEIPAGSLWPNTPSGSPLAIEVFGATGEYKSGKTLLGLSIAPGVHPAAHKFAQKPRTLLLDFEKSAGTYGGTGCQRVDVPSVLMAAGVDYAPLAVFDWFSKCVDRIEAGQYDLIMADPITDIESGLVEHVKKNCEKFGLSKNQVEKSGGLLWGAVKDYWKQVLLKLSTRCQCFFFTSHLRDVWAGNSPTGKREPKGKETLMELASLYLWLERKPDAEGKVPPVPSAIVLKERLADTRINDDGNLEIIQLMPPRLPVATAGAIRGYIANPPNYKSLKVGERVVTEVMSEEEKLRICLATAEADKDASASKLQILARQAELRAMATQAAATAPPKSSDQTAAMQAAKAAKAKAEAEQAEIDALKAKAEAEMEVLKKRQAELLASQPMENRMATQQPAATGPPDDTGNGDPNKATKSQVLEIRQLATDLHMDAHQVKAICQRAKVEKVSDLSRQLAHVLIEKLTAKKSGNGQQQTATASSGN